jgi:hypothetical protein
MLQFDLTGVTVTNLVSATLYLYVKARLAGNHQSDSINRATASWNESGMTWQNPTSAAYTTIITVPIGWHTCTVTSLVQGWVAGTYANYGIVLFPQDLNDGYESGLGKLANRTEANKAYISATIKVPTIGFSGVSNPWIFLKDMWEKHNKLWTPKGLILPKDLGFQI